MLKLTSFLLTCLLAGSLHAAAPVQNRSAQREQKQDSEHRRGECRAARKDPEKWAEEIGLDAAQSIKFVAIVSAQQTKQKALRERMRSEREAALRERQQIAEETFIELAKVLSAEQLAQFHAQRPPAHEACGRAHRRAHRAPRNR